METAIMLFLFTFCTSWISMGFLYSVHKIRKVRKTHGSLLNAMRESSDSDKFEEMIEEVGEERASRVVMYSYIFMVCFIWLYLLMYESMVKSR